MSNRLVRRRSTRHRQLLLELLRKTRSHPTARELYDQIRRFLPRTSLGTVYRNLEVLEDDGLVVRVPGETQARYDAATRPHHHLRCERCGRLDDLPAGPSTPEHLRLAADTGYKILTCRVTYAGLCPDCQRDGDTFDRPGGN